MEPEVSVVIPMYNAAGTIAEQLDALAGQSYSRPWEVIIADNGSTDGGPELVRRWEDRLPSLRVVDASAKRGVSHARNAGAAAARSDLILICDADDVVASGWLEAMATAPDHCDLLCGRLDDEALNDALVRSWRWRPPDGPPRTLHFLPYAIGNNCGVRRRVLDAVGGWNEDYVAGGDDVEFAWRAQLAGFRLCYVREAVLRVRYRGGLRALARQFYFYGFAAPRLYRDFRDRGAPAKPLGASVRDWLWLLVHLPDLLRSPAARGNWVRLAANTWGRARGSLRYRVVYL